jgi:hypothetical protein
MMEPRCVGCCSCPMTHTRELNILYSNPCVPQPYLSRQEFLRRFDQWTPLDGVPLSSLMFPMSQLVQCFDLRQTPASLRSSTLILMVGARSSPLPNHSAAAAVAATQTSQSSSTIPSIRYISYTPNYFSIDVSKPY